MSWPTIVDKAQLLFLQIASVCKKCLHRSCYAYTDRIILHGKRIGSDVSKGENDPDIFLGVWPNCSSVLIHALRRLDRNLINEYCTGSCTCTGANKMRGMQQYCMGLLWSSDYPVEQRFVLCSPDCAITGGFMYSGDPQFHQRSVPMDSLLGSFVGYLFNSSVQVGHMTSPTVTQHDVVN